MTLEAQIKFGKLYQYGVEYMTGFNADANQFLAVYNQYASEIQQNGYSAAWNAWKNNNYALITRLYDELNNDCVQLRTTHEEALEKMVLLETENIEIKANITQMHQRQIELTRLTNDSNDNMNLIMDLFIDFNSKNPSN